MPFPYVSVDDILPELDKAKSFTKVDSKDGYWQIKLIEESSLLTLTLWQIKMESYAFRDVAR